MNSWYPSVPSRARLPASFFFLVLRALAAVGRIAPLSRTRFPSSSQSANIRKPGLLTVYAALLLRFSLAPSGTRRGGQAEDSPVRPGTDGRYPWMASSYDRMCFQALPRRHLLIVYGISTFFFRLEGRGVALMPTADPKANTTCCRQAKHVRKRYLTDCLFVLLASQIPMSQGS